MYLPNGNPRPGPKFDYKLAWIDRLLAHAATLISTDAPVILAGDYNIIPTDLDVYKPERWRDDALFAPEARAKFEILLAQGWTDALRKLHPGGARSTPSGNIGAGSFDRDAGLRIDHFLLNAKAAKRLKAAGVDRAPRRLGQDQ